MFSRLVSLVFLLWLFCASPAFATSIVIMSFNKGIVIAADRKIRGAFGNFGIDCRTKIIPIVGSIALVNCGAVEQYIAIKNKQARISSVDVLSNFLSRRVTNSKLLIEYLEPLRDSLVSEYTRIQKLQTKNDWEGYPAQEPSSFMVFKFNQRIGQIEGLVGSFTFNPMKELPVEPELHYLHPVEFCKSRVFVMGADCHLLLSGQPPYVDVPSEPWFPKVTYQLVDVSQISETEALEIARRLLRYVHNNRPTLVGGTFDALSLSVDGDKWLCRNVSLDDPAKVKGK